MNRMEQIQILIEALLRDLPDCRPQAGQVPKTEFAQRRLLRGLMNLRPPLPLDGDFLAVQDALLSQEREERGVVEGTDLPPAALHPKLSLWQGDITRLRVDAIVNAANSALLGCFHPCHSCIDNAIHSAAGLQLRDECYQIMQAQGHPEPNGQAKGTGGYNLPASAVLHTVGPVVQSYVTQRDRDELRSCYQSCLTLAAQSGLQSVAFCCISTGLFHFPNREAAALAVQTVTEFLKTPSSIQRVVFNVFQDLDFQIYQALLNPGRP